MNWDIKANMTNCVSNPIGYESFQKTATYHFLIEQSNVHFVNRDDNNNNDVGEKNPNYLAA